MSGLYLFSCMIVVALAFDAFIVRPLERLAQPFTRRHVRRKVSGQTVNSVCRRLN